MDCFTRRFLSFAVLAVLLLPRFSWAARTLGNETVGGGNLIQAVVHEPELVYQRIRQAFFQDFHQPTDLRVTFHPTSASRLLGGYVSAIELEGLGGGVDYLELERFRIVARGLHFDFETLMNEGRMDVRRVDHMDLSLSVSEDAFNKIFRHHSRRLGVRNPRIVLHDGEVSFSGRVQAFVFQNQIEARGPLEITPEGLVNFNLRRLRVSGVTLPGFITRQIANRVNPLTDFRRFQFWKCWNMNLRAAIVREGSLTLSSFVEDIPEADAAIEIAQDENPEEGLPMLSRTGIIVLE